MWLVLAALPASALQQARQLTPYEVHLASGKAAVGAVSGAAASAVAVGDRAVEEREGAGDMNARDFLSKLGNDTVVAAIAEAEAILFVVDARAGVTTPQTAQDPDGIALRIVKL